jgi:hypothetical protein
VLDVTGILNIERYGRVNVDATDPQSLYRDSRLLAPEHNVRFLKRCIEGFREVVFAQQATGRIYLRITAGMPVLVDREALEMALADPDVRASVQSVAPGALDGSVAVSRREEYLRDPGHDVVFPTIGQWGRNASC